MAKTHNFRELQIWKEAIQLVKEIYALTGTLNSEEKFGLVSQINRSAVSIPSNIAEGSGRSSDKEFSRFLEIAISSSYELETQLILVYEIYSISTSDLIDKITSLQRKIGAFKRNILTN
jgi:four helix bundle protein